jgi:hypothetical protein
MYTDPFGKEHRYGPPQGWVPPDGSESLGPAEWDALIARGLHFEPTTHDTRVLVYGTCLEPLVVAGDLFTVRAVLDDEPLVDGGLYIIRWNDEAQVQKYREKIHAPDDEPILIAKFLRFIGSEWYCFANDGISALNGVPVSQVVGHTLGNRGGATTGTAQCATIDDNAATTIYLATNNFSGLAASGFAGKANTAIAFAVGSPPKVDCTVIVTVVVACHQSAGSGTVKIMIGYDDTGGTSYTWSVPEVLVTASSATYTLQYQYAHSAANLSSPFVVLGWDSSSTSNVLTADGYETFQSEYIKR